MRTSREGPTTPRLAATLRGVTPFLPGTPGTNGETSPQPAPALKSLSPAAPGTTANLPGTPGTNESTDVRNRAAIQPIINITPLGRVPQQSVNAARITRTGGSQGGPEAGGCMCPPSTVHRPPFSNAIHSRTNGARITLARTTQEGPAQARGRQCHGRPGSGRAQQKQQGPPPSPWRQMPRTQHGQREGSSRPRPSRATRHGCSRRANTQGPGRAAAHRSSSKMAGGI